MANDRDSLSFRLNTGRNLDEIFITPGQNAKTTRIILDAPDDSNIVVQRSNGQILIELKPVLPREVSLVELALENEVYEEENQAYASANEDNEDRLNLRERLDRARNRIESSQPVVPVPPLDRDSSDLSDFYQPDWGDPVDLSSEPAPPVRTTAVGQSITSLTTASATTDQAPEPSATSATAPDEPSTASETAPTNDASPRPASLNAVKICRFCLDDENQDDMCSPCKCSGTQAHVHQKCLNEWYAIKQSDLCPTCKTKMRWHMDIEFIFTRMREIQAQPRADHHPRWRDFLTGSPPGMQNQERWQRYLAARFQPGGRIFRTNEPTQPPAPRGPPTREISWSGRGGVGRGRGATARRPEVRQIPDFSDEEEWYPGGRGRVGINSRGGGRGGGRGGWTRANDQTDESSLVRPRGFDLYQPRRHRFDDPLADEDVPVACTSRGRGGHGIHRPAPRRPGFSDEEDIESWDRSAQPTRSRGGWGATTTSRGGWANRTRRPEGCGHPNCTCTRGTGTQASSNSTNATEDVANRDDGPSTSNRRAQEPEHAVFEDWE